jgi:hypothetical protein
LAAHKLKFASGSYGDGDGANRFRASHGHGCNMRREQSTFQSRL